MKTSPFTATLLLALAIPAEFALAGSAIAQNRPIRLCAGGRHHHDHAERHAGDAQQLVVDLPGGLQHPVPELSEHLHRHDQRHDGHSVDDNRRRDDRSQSMPDELLDPADAVPARLRAPIMNEDAPQPRRT